MTLPAAYAQRALELTALIERAEFYAERTNGLDELWARTIAEMREDLAECRRWIEERRAAK